MSLILKLQLNPDGKVLVTNSQTQKSREVNLSFIQDVTHDSLAMLIQYQYYELLRNTETIWQIVEQSDIKAEIENEAFSTQASSLILKLELKDNNSVLVTNSRTNESHLITMRYIQAATSNSLLMLVQYGYYELLINTEKVWQKVKEFDIEKERAEEVKIDQKFRDIMVNDGWMKITDYDRQMYNKALASWATTYNSQPNKASFDKFVFVPVAGGAIAGALTYSTIGGIGIAAAGTAFGVGALGLTALGSIGGLAAYGVGKAII